MFSEFQKNPDSLKSCYMVHMFHTRYFCLRVTFSNHYDLVPRNKVIFIQLLSEYPLDANNKFYPLSWVSSFSVICLSIRMSSSCFAITQSGSIRAPSTFLGSFSDKNPKKNQTFILSSSYSHSSVRISKNQESRMVFTPFF